MAKSTLFFYQNDSTRKALARIFSTVEELDQNHKAQVEYIYEQTPFRKDKKQRLRQLLNLIKTHSVNKAKEYLGICFLSINSMIDLFFDTYGKKISERAIQYLLKDLEELGLIQRIPTLRESDNRQSSNIYRTMKLEDNESTEQQSEQTSMEDKAQVIEQVSESQEGSSVSDSEDSTDAFPEYEDEFAHKERANLHSNKAHSSFKALSKGINTVKERKAKIVESIRRNLSKFAKPKKPRLLNFVPKAFRSLFQPLTSEPEEIYEFWKITKHICEKERGFSRETTMQAAESAFAEFFTHCKAAVRGKFEMYNPFGFYHAVLNAHSFAIRASNSQAGPKNWLQD